ncbi:MAG: copper chaperone PCu(A)C [Alphaproteobacteria bacterium]|nr:copper chaperone PCu(A)C [Alphaproteobacteria bacterium]
MLRTLFLATAFCLAAMTANAHDYKLGDLTIQHPWARASAGMAGAGGAFFTIVNGGASDKLLKAEADVSKVVELHTHIKDGEVMRMRQVPDIDVAGGTETKLAPGGLHVMLIGLKAPLKEGQVFPMTLTFEKSGTVTVEVQVQGVASSTPSHGPAVQEKKQEMQHKSH